MYKLSHPLFLICETPLHAGSGDDLGIVDLPIQRERHTSFPKIESSSLKGALRETFEETTYNGRQFAGWANPEVMVQRVFGFDDGSLNREEAARLKSAFTDVEGKKDHSEFAGCLALTDARLLFFPVKSMKGVFVWVTCPQILNRLRSDLQLCQRAEVVSLNTATDLEVLEGKCYVSDNKVCINNNVVLEEYAFEAEHSTVLRAFADEIAELVFTGESIGYWKNLFKTNLVLLSNNDFRDFVNQSTEVITRTKIDNNTGTVQDGALFTEEYLPVDSVLYALAMASKEYTTHDQSLSAGAVMQFFSDTLPEIFQLGGNASIGKGLLRTRLLNA